MSATALAEPVLHNPCRIVSSEVEAVLLQLAEAVTSVELHHHLHHHWVRRIDPTDHPVSGVLPVD